MKKVGIRVPAASISLVIAGLGIWMSGIWRIEVGDIVFGLPDVTMYAVWLSLATLAKWFMILEGDSGKRLSVTISGIAFAVWIACLLRGAILINKTLGQDPMLSWWQELGVILLLFPISLIDVMNVVWHQTGSDRNLLFGERT